MSDDPKKLITVPFDEAPPDLQKQFAALLADQAATEKLQETHLCWFFVPTALEWEKMRRFSCAPDYDKCPKCRKGRVVIEIYRSNLGESWNAVCKWGADGCDFKEYVSDDNNI